MFEIEAEKRTKNCQEAYNKAERFEKITNFISLLFLFLVFSALSVIFCKIEIYLLDKINVVFLFLLAALALLLYVIFDEDFSTGFEE